MKIDKTQPMQGDAFPPGVVRLDYRSEVDGAEDWALAWPHEGGTACSQAVHGVQAPRGTQTEATRATPSDWVVVIHGHGSKGDQLYVRQDIRQNWLPAFRQAGLGVLMPNLRLNAWMSPAAAWDLQRLLQHTREAFGAKRFLFASGSMGASSNLIYAVLHPEDVAGLIALGFVSDVATFHPFCRRRNTKLGTEVADAIEAAYGGTPADKPDLFQAHSAQARAERLTMPMYLSHGTADIAIPVSQARLLVGRLSEAAKLAYTEIPGGNHDSPLWKMGEGLSWVLAQWRQTQDR